MRLSRINLGKARDMDCLDLLLALSARLVDDRDLPSTPTAVGRLRAEAHALVARW